MLNAVIIEKRLQGCLKDKNACLRDVVEEPERGLAELCRRRFSRFLKEFWSEISSDALKWNWHIDYLCEELTKLALGVAGNQPRKHDLLINVPPGTTKSATCSIAFPPWCWTNWPWMRFIVSSYSGALSLEHAEYSRDLIRSDKFRQLFPYLEIKEDKDTKSNFRIMEHVFDEHGRHLFRRPGGNRYSTSVNGTVTGFHGHMLIVDDPLDPNRAVSETELRSANHWLDHTLSTRKIDKAVTPTILIMQRLHQDDPTGHILAKRKENTRHICLPGEIRNYRDQVSPAEMVSEYHDDLLDPVRMPWAVLKDLETDLGQYGYSGQIGQKPTPPGGGMFKVDHFVAVSVLPSPVNFVQTVRYWDKAGTEGGQGAFTVGVKMSRLKSGRFIVEDVKRGRWATEEREKIIRDMAEADGHAVQVYFEQEPGSGGKDSAMATTRNLAGFAAFADRPTGSKVARADPWSVQVNDGNVMLLRGEWNRDFTEEHGNFPFSTHKDQVDAASGAFAKLAAKRLARSLM